MPNRTEIEEWIIVSPNDMANAIASAFKIRDAFGGNSSIKMATTPVMMRLMRAKDPVSGQSEWSLEIGPSGDAAVGGGGCDPHR